MIFLIMTFYSVVHVCFFVVVVVVVFFNSWTETKMKVMQTFKETVGPKESRNMHIGFWSILNSPLEKLQG